MSIQWTESLAVGIPLVDEQHKELFNRVNMLLDASSKGKGKEEITGLVEFLGAYVVTHFRSEEGQMAQAGYPSLTAHKQLHSDFINDFEGLRVAFKANGATTVLVLQLQHKVVEWLLQHIGKEDKAFGAFLRARA